MSKASATGQQSTTQTYVIPSLLTNSFRAVVEHFGTDITSIHAEGSVETTNGSFINGLREYGVSREQRSCHRVRVEYERRGGRDGSTNALTPDVQERIFEELDAILGADHLTSKPDLAVSEVTIRVEDERLQEVTPAQTPEFDLRFIADQAEGPAREVTKLLNDERGIYKQQSFNIRNLNLRSVEETETKYHQQTDGRYMSWQGPGDIRPRSPERLAIRINDNILPEKYGTLKPYYVADDQILELPEDALEDIEARLFGGSTGTGGDGQ